MKSIFRGSMAIATLLLCGLTAAQPEGPDKGLALDIDAQPLVDALNTFARQSGMQVLVNMAEVPAGSLRAPRLVGRYTAEAALAELLANTGLKYEFVNERTVRISSGATAPAKTSAHPAGPVDATRNRHAGAGLMRLAQLEAPAPDARMPSDGQGSQSDDMDGDPEDTRGTPEILVKGRRSLNVDIERTEDAPQPYVVFHKDEIERSQAIHLEEFLRTRLPMNTASTAGGSSGVGGQQTGNPDTRSGIDLRGLGLNQTLILVDGRRLPELVQAGSPRQPDINGIPLSAVERIEVLPSTASGIYGGSATGGVINIILRRDYQGLDARTTYTNTFDTDTGNARITLTAGLNPNQGRTRILAAASISRGNRLVIGDRDFAARAIALQMKNNPSNIAALTTPPLGATVNIRSVGGVPLVLKPEYGGTPLGAAFTHIPLGYAGPESDSGAALVANAGRYNLDLPGGMGGADRGLVSAPSSNSYSLNIQHEFGERLKAFLDASQLGNRGSSYSAVVPSSVANLPAQAPNNPFQQAIAVSFPTPGLAFRAASESTTLRATGGLIAHLPHNWMSELSYSWSRSRWRQALMGAALDSVGSCVLGRGVAANVILGGPPATLDQPCAAGDPRPALNVLQEGNTFPIDFTPYLLDWPSTRQGPSDTVQKSATLHLSGPVLDLPGGALRLSALLERRRQAHEGSFTETTTAARTTVYTFYPGKSKQIDSAYLEARIPLISRRNAQRAARELELQASVRRDEYTSSADARNSISLPSREGPFPELDFARARTGSTDYTLGIRYMPVQDVALRASFGTGFLPPSITQIAPAYGTSSINWGPDPERGGTPMYVGVPYETISGGSPSLKPETSESWSFGLILTPRILSALRLSVDYTRIKKKDEIQVPQPTFLMNNEALFPGRIVRGPNLETDLPGWAGPIILLDTSPMNIASTLVEALDFGISHNWELGRFGTIRSRALATRLMHNRNQTLPGTPFVERVGHSGGPLEWRGNFGLDWTRGPLIVGWNTQYYHSYFVYNAQPLPLTPAQETARATAILNQGSDTIPRQIYHDLILTWRFDATTQFARGLLANSEIAIGIQNVFNTSPPILASSSPISTGYSTYGDPRLRRYSINVRKSFGWMAR